MQYSVFFINFVRNSLIIQKLFNMKYFFSIFLFCLTIGLYSQNIDIKQPRFLKKGDKVALISPAYYLDVDLINKAAEVFKDWGLVPVVGKNVGFKYAGNYAGTIEQRAEDLLWALQDDEIKAIICNRGGYGAIHLFDRIPLDTFSDHPKWLVGFSDITTLHSFETVAGCMSIHGTMPSFIAKTNGTDISSIVLKDMLFGKIPEYHIPNNKYNINGFAEGVLVGGNLAVLSALGGSYLDATNLDNIILFIEDIGENKRNIDRLFNTLRVRGVFNRVKALIIGDFSESANDLDYDSVEQMLNPYLQKMHIPVCCGFPIGHGDINLPLIYGAKVKLIVNEHESVLSFSVSGQNYILNYPE